MTKEELAKIPFKTGGHLALEGEYRQYDYYEQYGFALVDITKRSSQGFVAGKTRREYLYKGKRYRSMDKFLEAIKDVEFKG